MQRPRGIKDPAGSENLREFGYSEGGVVRVSRGQGLRGSVGYAKEISSQSMVAILGV